MGEAKSFRNKLVVVYRKATISCSRRPTHNNDFKIALK